MYHDLSSTWLAERMLLRRNTFPSLVLAVLSHFHILITIAFAFTFFLVKILFFAATAFRFKVLAAGVRGVVVIFDWVSVRGAGCILGTAHGVIFGAVRLYFGFDFVFGFLFFELFFLSAVRGTVIVDYVGFGLLRWVFGRGRLLSIPVQDAISLSSRSNDNVARAYHLMANLVTLGFSASTFLLTLSMIGFAGGSAFSSSESYSLLT